MNADDGVDLAQILTIGSIVVTVGLLAWSLSKGRRRSRLRPLFDVARLVVQTAVVVAIPAITGVSTAAGLIVGAVMVGGALGFLQGQHLEVTVESSKLYTTRTVIGFAVWGAGLVMMQGAGLANRTGLVEVGQGLSWFSIGMAIGLILGRQTKVGDALRMGTAGVVAAVVAGSALGALLTVRTAEPAAAVDCPAPPNGFTLEGTSFSTCQYRNAQGVGAAVSESSSGCGADLTDDWDGTGGTPGQSLNVKNDEPYSDPEGEFTWFQRHLLLMDGGIVAVASRNYEGGIAEQFHSVAAEYARMNFISCGTTAPPPTDTGEEQPAAPPPRTEVVPEDIDPDAVPDTAPIDDEGGDLFPADADADEPNAADDATDPDDEDGADDDEATTGDADRTLEPDDDEGTFAAPDPGTGDDGSDGDDDGDDRDTVTADEALAASIAGVIAAALAGLITWAEAISSIDQLLAGAGRDQNAAEIVDEVRSRFAAENAAAPPIDPTDAANDIFRDPATGNIHISDGSQGAPPGHVWDPWSGRWLSPAEAAAERARVGTPPLDEYGDPMPVSNGHERFPDGAPVPPGWVQVTDPDGTPRWVSPEEARDHIRGRSDDLDRQAERDAEWDRETEQGRRDSDERNRRQAEERREAEEAEARGREEERAAADAAYDQLERIRAAAERRGWDDVVARIDNAFDAEGNIDPAYVDRLATAVSNRIGLEIAGQNPTPSMLAETLRSLDEDYGDVIPDFMIDQIQHQLEQTWFGDFTVGTLRDMRESTSLRILGAIASGGTSEVAYQSADLGDAILADIDRAIAEGRDPDQYMVLRNTARVLVENNMPINSARLAFGDRPVSAEEALMALVGDLGAAFDIGTMGQRGAVLGEMPWQAGVDAHAGAAASAARRAAAEAADRLGGAGTAARIGDAATSAREAVEEGLRRGDAAVGRPGMANTVPESARGAAGPDVGSGRPRVPDADVPTTPRTADVDTPTGRTADTDTPTTRTPDTDTPTTRTPDTDTPTGRTPDTDTPTGRTPDTDTPTGRTPDTDTPTGRTPDTDTPTGRTPDTDTPTGRTPDTDTPTGRTPDTDTPTAGGAPEPSDDWLQRSEPGTRIPEERIRETGYTPEQAEALRDVASRHDAIIGTRTTNIHSTRFIEDGTAVPKPVWMKPKTINEIDELLGGPPANVQGQVGFYEPRLPSPPVPDDIMARYNQRLAEYRKLQPELDRLRAEGVVEVRDGVVHKVIDPGPPPITKPFAGDIDAVVILNRDGSPVSGARYDAIVDDLQRSGAMLQHGAEANLVDDILAIKARGLEAKGLQPGSIGYRTAMARARRDAQDLFASLNTNHLDGAEQVIWSGPGGHTVGGRLEELGGWQERVRGRFTDAAPPNFIRTGTGSDD